MRQRKIKNIEEKLAFYDALLISNPESNRGKWLETFGSAAVSADADVSELYVEIGCGKGRFITESALNNPDCVFLAFEGQESVLYRALQRACAGPEKTAREIHESAQIYGPNNAPKNLRFVRTYIETLSDFFEDGEASGIYLNFSDPWPKSGQEHRRLTSPHYIEGYQKALKAGGFLRFKTDNEDLFAYSIEKIKAQIGFEITKQTDDLHHSEYAKENIETEYERKFRNLRRNTHFVEAIKCQ